MKKKNIIIGTISSVGVCSLGLITSLISVKAIKDKNQNNPTTNLNTNSIQSPMQGNQFNLSLINNSSTEIQDGILHIPEGCEILTGSLNPVLNINRISFPTTLTTISSNPFVNCDNIIDINIPLTNQYFSFSKGILIDNINHRLVASFEKVIPTTLSVPQDVIEIEDQAFYSNNRLKRIIIPYTVKNIGNNAFGVCRNLLDVKMPTTFFEISYPPETTLNFGLSQDQWNNISWVNSETNQEYYAFDLSKITRYSESVVGKTLTIPKEYGQIKGQLNPAIEIENVIFEQGSPIDIIPQETFRNCKFLKTVNLPENLMKIGDYAFSGCKMLQSVNIFEKLSKTLVSIGTNAFNNCSNLANIILPDTFKDSNTNTNPYGFNNYQWKNINWNGIANQINLDLSTIDVGHPYIVGRELIIPTEITNLTGSLNPDLKINKITFENTTNSKIKSIPDRAFLYCENLVEIVIPSGVISIGANAFQKCTKLSKLTLPNTITTISDYSFSHCYQLASLEIPSSLTTLGTGAFDSCNKINNLVLPSAINSIQPFTFSMCTSLSSLTFENDGGLVDVGSNAFFNTDITQLKLNDSMIAIKDHAFAGMRKLTKINWPKSLTSIGNYAFDECWELDNIANVPNTVNKIGTGAFASCMKLSKIILPSTVTEINDETFFNCQALTTITTNGNISKIGNNAFNNCLKLSSYSFKESINTVGNYAFKNCQSLTTVQILKTMETFGTNVFEGCTKLTKVEIENGVTSLNNDTFKNCTSLTSLTIPNSCVTLGDRVFSGCVLFNKLEAKDTNVTPGSPSAQQAVQPPVESSPENPSETVPEEPTDVPMQPITPLPVTATLTIPSNITTFGINVFENCNDFAKVVFSSNTITEIPTGMFYNCDNLEQVTIPSSCTSIGKQAFQNCDKLNSIVNSTNSSNGSTNGGTASKNNKELIYPITNIPSSIKTIKDSAFQDCLGLYIVNIPNNVNSIGTLAFTGCYNLRNVKISNNSITLAANVFNYTYSFSNDLTITFNSTDQMNKFMEAAANTITSSKGQNNFYYEVVNNSTSSTVPGSKATSEPSNTTSTSITTKIFNFDNVTDSFLNNGVLTILENITATYGNVNGVKNMTGIVWNSSKIESFTNEMFRYNTELTSFILGESSPITTIPDRMFGDCPNLQNVVLSSKVNTFKHASFLGCNDKINVTFNCESVLTFDNNVFAYKEQYPKNATFIFKSQTALNSFLNAPVTGGGKAGKNNYYFEVNPSSSLTVKSKVRPADNK